MTVARHIIGAARRLVRDDQGSALVEFAIVLPLFLLLFFGLIDFGRMGGDFTFANKPVQRAARIAVVRPPVCNSVPLTNARGTVPPGTVPPRFGTSCTAGGSICAVPTAAVCTGQVGNATSDEIWAEVGPLLPAGATPANLRYTYTFDPALNFLGGPYVPVVKVEITNLQFTFVSPLGALAALAGAATGSGMSGTVTFPAMTMTLPGEDLALGNNG